MIESANWEIPGYATGVYHVLVHNGQVLLCCKQLQMTHKGDVGTGQDHRRLHRAQRRLLCGEEHQSNGCLQQSLASGGYEKLSSCLGESLFSFSKLYISNPTQDPSYTFSGISEIPVPRSDIHGFFKEFRQLVIKTILTSIVEMLGSG